MIDSLMLFADDFIKYKHSNGYVYVTATYHIKKYVAFSSATAPREVVPSKDTINAFLHLSNKTPGSLYNIASALREFCKYLVSIGHKDAYIIPLKKVHLPTPVQPYLFTTKEIEAFFRQCDEITINPYYKTRHIVLPAMYRLLYCCGLRCKEVRTLLAENVHLDRNYIDVLQSKGPNSRRIFITNELSEYLKSYDKKIRIYLPNRKMFFPNRHDRSYGANFLLVNFKRFWYQAYPKKKNDGVSIRPYDFRHHFAYTNLNRWLKEGKDINTMLPYLMKYMGHSEIEHTLYYFHLVPDIYGAIVEKSGFYENLIPEVEA